MINGCRGVLALEKALEASIGGLSYRIYAIFMSNKPKTFRIRYVNSSYIAVTFVAIYQPTLAPPITVNSIPSQRVVIHSSLSRPPSVNYTPGGNTEYSSKIALLKGLERL